MSIQSLLIILLVGAIAGWLAGKIMRGTGFGLIGDIVVGLVGALIGNWLFGYLHIGLPGGPIIAAIISATIGAVILLAIIGLIKRR